MSESKLRIWLRENLDGGRPSLEELNREQSSGVAGDRSSIDRVIRESVEFENRRSWYNARHGELEYSSITFLGCSMEMLRSSLAKWAERNNGGGEGSWRPSLFLTDGANEREKAKFVCQFSASADFTSCLESVQCCRTWRSGFSRCVCYGSCRIIYRRTYRKTELLRAKEKP